MQRVAERLRFGALDAAVAEPFGLEPGAAVEAGAFGGAEVGGFGGCAGGRGFAGGDHVDVRGFAGGGVEEADGAGYPGAPVAALGDCCFGDEVNYCTMDGGTGLDSVDGWKGEARGGEEEAWETCSGIVFLHSFFFFFFTDRIEDIRVAA